jgi:hypothetical protein
MAIPIIVWVLVGVAAGAVIGAAVTYFWDEIKAWANQAMNKILDGLNLAILLISEGIVYFVEEGGILYKLLKVYIQNVHTRQTEVITTRQPISRDQIPSGLHFQSGEQILKARVSY